MTVENIKSSRTAYTRAVRERFQKTAVIPSHVTVTSDLVFTILNGFLYMLLQYCRLFTCKVTSFFENLQAFSIFFFTISLNAQK